MEPNVPECIYQSNPLANVICQLRFPQILSINSKAPAEFQELVRDDFPLYSMKPEPVPPQLVSRNGSVAQLQQEPVKNYCFRSPDDGAALNLTESFLSISTAEYYSWEHFAAMVDKAAAALITLYRPAFFERIGLRYINAVSREELGLGARRWSELIDPRFCGMLDLSDISDSDFSRCSQDAEFRMPGGCNARVHAGPGMLKRSGHPDGTARFVLDFDLYIGGKILPQHLTGALQTAHTNAGLLFRSAITEELHRAMRPE